MAETTQVRKVRVALAVLMLGLVVSGVTAFPLETELKAVVRVLQHENWQALATATGLLPWMQRVGDGLLETNRRYPFLAYGTDWLAFGHLVIAVAFLGPYRDPVRNEWLITFGLVACAGVIPLALIAGALRGVPLPWRFVDCSFGVLGAIPLLLCRRWIRDLKVARQQNTPLRIAGDE